VGGFIKGKRGGGGDMGEERVWLTLGTHNVVIFARAARVHATSSPPKEAHTLRFMQERRAMSRACRHWKMMESTSSGQLSGPEEKNSIAAAASASFCVAMLSLRAGKMPLSAAPRGGSH
jgi:hypothetical protein